MATLCQRSSGLGSGPGAYMFGKLLGKHKLAPKLLPRKTSQWFIGGLLRLPIHMGLRVWANLNVAPVILLISNLVVAGSGFCTMTTESMFKREAGN